MLSLANGEYRTSSALFKLTICSKQFYQHFFICRVLSCKSLNSQIIYILAQHLAKSAFMVLGRGQIAFNVKSWCVEFKNHIERELVLKCQPEIERLIRFRCSSYICFYFGKNMPVVANAAHFILQTASCY